MLYARYVSCVTVYQGAPKSGELTQMYRWLGDNVGPNLTYETGPYN